MWWLTRTSALKDRPLLILLCSFVFALIRIVECPFVIYIERCESVCGAHVPCSIVICSCEYCLVRRVFRSCCSMIKQRVVGSAVGPWPDRWNLRDVRPLGYTSPSDGPCPDLRSSCLAFLYQPLSRPVTRCPIVRCPQRICWSLGLVEEFVISYESLQRVCAVSCYWVLMYIGSPPCRYPEAGSIRVHVIMRIFSFGNLRCLRNGAPSLTSFA